MDATRYVITQASTGVAIRLPDGFRFRDGREVWRLLHPEEWPYREYVLDFGEVSTISDCGIAWLRFFLGWAQAAQVTVRLSGVSEALASRMMEAERRSAASLVEPGHAAGSAHSSGLGGGAGPGRAPAPSRGDGPAAGFRAAAENGPQLSLG